MVSNFITKALTSEPLTVYGDGTQTRSFCYVDDTISGLTLPMESPPELTGPVNLGNPQEISILNLAEITIELTSSKSKMLFCYLPENDPKRRNPDILLFTTLKRQFGERYLQSNLTGDMKMGRLAR